MEEMTVKIEFPVSFNRFVGGQKYIKSAPGKLVDILAKIKKKYPDFSKIFFKSNNELKSFVILFLDNKVVEKGQIQKFEVDDGQIIRIVMAIGGG